LVGLLEGFIGDKGVRAGFDMPWLTLGWKRVALNWPDARNALDAFMFASSSAVDRNRGKISVEKEIGRRFAGGIALRDLGDALSESKFKVVRERDATVVW
jgi:hypothetical protein